MSKILCIDRNAIKDVKGLEKKLPLETILKENTKYLDYHTGEHYIGEHKNYVPLTFSTTVRSMYSNKVVYKNTGTKRLFYESFSNIEEVIHKGYDLVMFLSSIAIQKMVNPNIVDSMFTLSEIMASSSTFSVRGLRYNADVNFLSPIVYSQIVIEDEAFERFVKLLDNVDYNVCTIEEMRSYAHGNILDLLDDIVICRKEDNENE